ncbi:MAG: hypothetical protein KC708_21565 [Anaerolineae bacterium]|nr:hypothetical protein [Anaerolineae bacterium]
MTDRGFTGHRSNNKGAGDMGLIYMNARYYLPGVGRFVSADSLVSDPANPQSFNRYSYVLNSPLNFTDPTGHFCVVQRGGRGFVQLTGRINYSRMGDVFNEKYGVNILENPGTVATNVSLAADIAVYGMVNGSFTGYSFADAAETNDFFYNARRIINGSNDRQLYKNRALSFRDVLQ